MSAVKEIQAVTPYGETGNVLELSIDVSNDAYVLEDVVKIVGDYSFSIWVKSAKSNCLTTFNVLGTSITESITTKWKKVSTTVKIDSLDDNDINIIPDINTTIYLYEGFLSEGTIDNSWIPAPEDSEENMESIKSEFNQTADRIEQKVTSFDGRITTLSTTVDGVDTEIKNARGDSTSLKARIDGISIIANNADGKTTKLEANIDGINGEINDAKGNSTTLKEKIDGISADVSNVSGEVGKVNVRAESIELGLSKKKDITPFNIRYIRDWQKGNSVDTTCRWTNIQVIVNNTNIESGEVNIIQPSSITLSSDVSITNITNFVDGNVSTYASYATNTEWHYIQIDLGADNTFDEGTITVWHRYDDTNLYRFNHKLEISSDGKNWYSLFNSEVTDAYEENSYGKSYLINDGLITKNLSFLRLDINSITEKVQENTNNYAQLKVESNALTGRVEGVENTTSDLQDTTIPNLDTKLTKNISEVKQQADSISNRVSKVEGTVEKQTQEIIDANGWRVEMANIGAYPEDPSIATKVVSMALSNEGVTINRAASEGYRTQLTGDTVRIQYDNGRGVYDDAMKIDKDLMYLTRLMVRNGIDHGTLKEIPTNYTVNGNNVGCLVFISSSGNS